MKAIVKKEFKDKNTQINYKINSIFEDTEERINEINQALNGALEIKEEQEPEPEQPKKRKKRNIVDA